jgi:predicted  nucleic acid-binding Zn-ribbon protein
MESEALRNIRTMRQLKTGLDIAKSRKPRTTNSLSQTTEEVGHLESLADRQLKQILAKEKNRFTAREAAVDKSRKRMLRLREKLAVTINRNRALTELRYKLQQAHWGRKGLAVPTSEPPAAKQGLHQVELKY